MGLKIHDFCAVRIRCLVIVEIICLIFFAAGCTGKTVEGVKEDFPFETVQLASEYGTLYIQASSYSEEIGKEILQQFDTDVETAVQRTGCGGCLALHCGFSDRKLLRGCGRVVLFCSADTKRRLPQEAFGRALRFA